MNIYVFNYSKKINSTKHPVMTDGTLIIATLKEPCSVMHPVFTIKNGNYNFNYLGVNLYHNSRFYFVDDIIRDGAHMDIICTLDVLGTNKFIIGAYEGHIARCSDNTFYNNKIIDNMNPAVEENDIVRVSGDVLTGSSDPQTNMFQNSDTDGSYILTVCGKTQGVTKGFSTSYALTKAQLLQLHNKFNDANFIDQIKNEFTNPLESIISCKFVPIKSSDMYTTVATESIYIGSNDTQINGLRLTSEFVYGGIDLALPTALGDYRDAPPFSTYSMYLPFVGVVPLDYQMIEEKNKLLMFCYVDVITGDTIYKIVEHDTNDYDKILATYSGNCATEVPISSNQYSPSSIVSGALATIGGAVAVASAVATGGAIIPALAGVAGGLGLTIKGTETHTQINGSISTALSAKVDKKVSIIITRKNVSHSIDAMKDIEGLPCHKLGRANAHAGYIQFLNASITGVDAFAEEIKQMNEFMNNGFYYE